MSEPNENKKKNKNKAKQEGLGSRRERRDERDFTGGAILALSPHRGSTGDPEIDQRIVDLVRDWGCEHGNELIEEMIITALRLGKDNAAQGDLKLINRTLKELRAANRIFQPYHEKRKVAIYGSARTEPEKPEYQAAVEFGRKMAEAGFMGITGAGDGIMGAGQKGSGRDNSFGLNINLPFEQQSNETIVGDSKLIEFNYFFTRKLSFVKEADACALFPGGFGTMDEGFENLTLMQTGKSLVVPMVMVDAPGGTYWKTFKQFVEDHLLRLGMISETDFAFFKVTDDVDEAVEEIVNFYRIFHSYRYVGDKLVIRIRERLSDRALELLNAEFGDLVKEGKIEQGEALKAERNEASILDFPRLVFRTHRRALGRHRMLIDTINASELQGDQ